MARAERYQKQQKFWLNLNNPIQADLYHYCEVLRDGTSKFTFAGTIRDGLRLIRDLRQGKLDVLFELFPFVRAEFLEYMKEVKAKSDDSLPVQQINSMYEQLSRIEKMMQQGETPSQIKSIGGNLTLPDPTFDDDDDDLLEVQEDSEAGQRSAQNFLNSLARLQG